MWSERGSLAVSMNRQCPRWLRYKCWQQTNCSKSPGLCTCPLRRCAPLATVPAKWKMVLRCMREAAGADAGAVAALHDATIERLYRRVAWKLIMQPLINEIYATHAVVVHSPTARRAVARGAALGFVMAERRQGSTRSSP